MHPILFHIGSFPIHTYGFLGAVGFLLVVGLSIWRARQIGQGSDGIVDIIFWSAVFGVIGARGLWVLQYPEMAPTPWDWINIRQGGLVFYGAMILGIPAALVVMWRRKMPMLAVSDVFAAALPLGHGISRIGCFFAGCCYGSPTDVPWAVVFNHSLADAPQGVAVHPTQLYEAAILFAITGILQVMLGKKRFDGQVLLSYLGLYALSRFVIETLRGDITRGYFWEAVLGQTLTLSQGVAVLMLAVVAVGWTVLSRRASVTEASA